ncbi:hypothetical protein E2976_18340 [Paracoccus yeei]|uniref:NUMOD1 domain-containing DNA-binding protein n=1 Tax=Paracoccus yeei TaxID=147645 RepID=UPI003BF856C2
MSFQAAVAIPGYPSATAAARALGVTSQTIYKHLRTYGNLGRLERFAAATSDPRGIALPDGGYAASVAEAARALGVSEACIYNHLCKHGHLRGAGLVQRIGSGAPRRVSLADVPGVDVPELDSRPETAPRGSCMVAARPADVDAVIATIRQCRDDYLAERGERAHETG